MLAKVGLGLLIILFIIGLYWLYTKRARTIPNVPRMPGAVFFLGNFIKIIKNDDRFWPLMNDTYKKFGKTFYFSIPYFTPMVLLAPHADTIRYVLKDNFYNYIKSPQDVEQVRELFGKGIFATDGAEWRPQRKIASHMFALRNLRDYMVGVFIKDGHKVLDCLRNYAENNEEIDLQKLFFSYTFSSFSEIAFGKDPQAINRTVPFAVSFDRIQALLDARDVDPFWKLKRFFQIGSREREIVKHGKVINEYAYGEIRNRKKSNDREKNPDLISRFLTYAEKSKITLSDEYLRDVVVNFMIAGRDTTAAALSWLFFELDQHPDVAKKMTDEVCCVLEKEGKKGKGLDRLSHKTVNEMHYCKAAFSEALRLHPSVPGDAKSSIRRDTLPDGTTIPGGMKIIYSPWIFGRSTELWGADALEFRPERWLVDSENGYVWKDESQFKFIAFNAGLRLCLGKPLAYLEAIIITAMILYSNLRLRLKPEHDISITRSIILSMQYGLTMTVHHGKYQESDEATPFRNPQKNII